MSDFVSGAAGVLTGALLSSAAWVFAARTEVRIHDAEAAEMSHNLSTWARNRGIQLAHERQDIVNRANERGALSSGARVNAERALMARAGDEADDRAFAEGERWSVLKASEDFRHRMWRSRVLGGKSLEYLNSMEEYWIRELRKNATLPSDVMHLAFDPPVE